MFGMTRSKKLVGLDIGTYAVKAVELNARKQKGGTRYELARIGFKPLPPDAIVEGTVIDAAAVAEAVRILFDENKISTRDVVISISGNSVIIKKISLPEMDRLELAESITWEAKHNIPYPYEETSIDYVVLPSAPGKSDTNLNILIVAAKKDKIANYNNVVNQARKNIEAIEVDVFALHNALEINYPEIMESKTAALVNIGANITNVIITERGIPQLFRDLSIGGYFFTENIRKELNVSFDESERLLKGLPGTSVSADQFSSALALNIRDLLDEMEKTFAFFEATEKEANQVEQILLSGGLANIPNITEAFENKFQIPTELFNPFRRIHYDDKKFDPIYFSEMAPIFGVAVGLSTRKAER